MNRYTPKRKTTVSVIALLMLVVMLFSSCSGFLDIFETKPSSVRFEAKAVEIKIGEVFAPKVTVLPSMASNKRYELSTSSTDILEINNAKTVPTVRALKTGKAILTVTTVKGELKDTCEVTVSFAVVSSITLLREGDIIQHTGAVSKVSFSAVANNFADPNAAIEWSVNGQKIEGNASNALDFTPQDQAGAYVVRATAADTIASKTPVYDEDTVYVYVPINDAVLSHNAPFDASPDDVKIASDASMEQSEVEFEIDYSKHIGNPPPIIEWRINDEIAQYGGDVFRHLFSKTGVFEISATLNEKTVPLANGAEFVVVHKLGTIVPQNITVDYDNAYPDVLVSWDYIDGINDYEVKIGNNTYSSKDFASRFDGNVFNAVGLCDITKVNTFSVRSLGRGYFSDSAFSAPVTPMPLTGSLGVITPFLQRYYFDSRNRYLVSQAELNDLVAYMIMFRLEKLSAYVAFDLEGSAEDAFLHGFNATAATGRYFYDVEFKQNIITIYLEYVTTNVPTKHTGWTSLNQFIGNPSAYPHIGEGSRNITEFAIDRRPSKVSVENSEQLYYVASLGLNPQPVEGSRAERIYNAAKNVLRNIISNSMSAADKAHAIYDYIMYINTYDSEVLKHIAIESAVLYNAFYLEGIFDSPQVLAVCDGIAKAAVLMLNIEGIPAIKVNGAVGYGSAMENHAWVKANIDGSWYIIDPTWGDAEVYISRFTAVHSYATFSCEIAGHEYLFLTDDELSTHFENSYSNYPKTPTEPYDFYAKSTFTVGSTAYSQSLNNQNYVETAFAAVDYLMTNKENGNPHLCLELKLTHPLILGALSSSNVNDNPILKAFSNYDFSDFVVYVSPSIKNSYVVYIMIKP